MKFCIIVCIILTLGINYVSGKISHLLVSSVGEGVMLLDGNQEEQPITSSSFLPNDIKLSVRPKSGIETLAAGYLFRFGSSTIFKCSTESIKMFYGSLFIRSRNFKNVISISGPETSLKISGAGSCLLEVETNGGFKCVGVLGTLRLVTQNNDSLSLLPGELVITESSNNKLSDKLTVDLGNLFETSFLISGFSNSSSFDDALKSVASSQKLVIGKSYNANEVKSKEGDNFERVTNQNHLNPSVSSSDAENTGKFQTNYQLPNNSPLQELLGRSPKRLKSPAVPQSLPSETGSSSVFPPARPFPSRLLRGN